MDELLDTRAAAPRVGVSPVTLENWRSPGIGTKFIKTSGKRGRVLYDPVDIEAWKEANRFQSTSEAEAVSSPMTDLSIQILEFVPGCTAPREMEQREVLLKARDYSISLITARCHPTAFGRAIAAREIADAYAFADVPIARLDIAVSYCRHLVQCAFLADHLEGEALDVL